MINEIERLNELLKENRPTHLTRADESLPPPRSGTPGFTLSHTHRLAVPLRGCHKMEIARNGKIVNLEQKRGGVTFMPTGVWNRVDWYIPVEVATFIFGKEDTYLNYVKCPGDGRVGNYLNRILLPPMDLDDRLLMTMLLNCADSEAGHNQGILLACLLIHRTLEKKPCSLQSKGDLTYRNICSWLEENWASRPDRTEAATLFKITPNYLSNLFKSRSGRSFSAHINHLRIEQAKKLLLSENLTLGEIAYRCGLSDPAYFCRIFKKETGFTPLKYRLSAVGDSPEID